MNNKWEEFCICTHVRAKHGNNEGPCCGFPSNPNKVFCDCEEFVIDDRKGKIENVPTSQVQRKTS